MIYTLTLNPALDYDMYLMNDLEVGKLNLSKEINYRAAGKGINVSKVLKNLDVLSTAIGYIAGFTGDFIERDLEKSSINTDFIRIEGCTRINVKVNGNDTETELTGLSPTISDAELTKLIKKVSELKEGDILVLAGSLPTSVASNIYKKISENVNEKVEIVLDTRGNLLKENIHNNLFIKPNIHELREMFNENIETTDEIIEKCQYFLEKGVKNVIISRGGDGALLVNKDTIIEASVPKGKLINSIGAGDSMVAGFVYGIETGMDIENSFKMAVACGSATAYSYGLAEKELVEKLYTEIVLTKKSYK